MTTPTLPSAIALIQHHLDLQSRLNEPGSVEQVRQVYDDMREMVRAYRDNPLDELAAVRKQRDALLALCRAADVHLGWGDCTLRNLHDDLRAAIAACEPAAGEGEA